MDRSGDRAGEDGSKCVLVLGAHGFIGGHVVTALLAAGHTVIAGARGARLDPRFPTVTARACDLACDHKPTDWLPRLKGVDRVVNCAGILREAGKVTFEAVHEQSVAALGQACVAAGGLPIIQISALGQAEDGAFIASKHRGDASLLALNLSVTVLRPALVYSAAGSYGGTSLLRAMAALPGMIVVPQCATKNCVQPIDVNDVAQAVVAAVARPPKGPEVMALVGPQPMALTTYLSTWRQWLGFGPARVWAVPTRWVQVACWLGERFGKGPMGQSMMRMLEHGNLGQPEALGQLADRLSVRPRALEVVLAGSPSHVQDRWHARLVLLLPLLKFSVIALWLGSGVVGWLTSPQTIAHLAEHGPMSPTTVTGLARVMASVDLILGAAAMHHRWRRWAWGLMAAEVVGYTLAMGLFWPTLWADPMGGLIKNLPLVVSLGVLWVTEDRR